ncbi:MAG TPA: bifunctional precorrin-2 dehydrogenase/sirohydrochlorin ferrochelatase [Thermoanaerobaculia bacterium]|nr:bifunctional precorrin-2 dehydrogenase/sirohydrochlorin ferrochelatase [Thermoanaerobaculia bacterium]
MGRKKFPYYPIYLDVEDRDVLIVGGGSVCQRKAETMLRYGARVTIVAPRVTDEIAEWAKSGRVTVALKSYDELDLDGRSMVIASTDDPCVNARIARDCRRRRIPVNVVDVPHLCEFIVPAIVETGSIQIAVSTGGKSPALARTLKEDLQKLVGAEYAEANDLLGSLRKAARKALPSDADRKEFFDRLIAQDLLGMLRRGERRRACETIARHCAAAGVPLSDAVKAGLERLE